MLKIHKGLKKKKKDKKHKRKEEEELFNAAELEKYRQEHQQEKRAELQEPTNCEVQSDEWKKFKALTTGVDDVLKKTQSDLNRIKSTSFFQRKAPKCGAQQPAENAAKEATEEPATESTSGNKVQVEKQFLEVEKGEEADDEESDIDDSIFDTSYVDVVTSGNLKLVHVPDTPEEQDIGFDPFDTSIADKFVKQIPKSRQVNLGCAVQVLSGKLTDPAIPRSVLDKKQPRRRPKPADLLLGSFDEVNADIPAATPAESPVKKTLLDEDILSSNVSDLTIVEGQVKDFTLDLSVNLAPKQEVIEPLSTPLPSVTSESSDDEFAKLAAESLSKKPDALVIVGGSPTPNPTDSSLDGALQSQLPTTFVPFEVNFDLPNEVQSSSTTHTVSTEFGAPTKVFNKDVQSVLESLEDDDFDPRAETPIRPDHLDIKPDNSVDPTSKLPVISPNDRLDLLKIEHNELIEHDSKTLTPVCSVEDDLEFVDPFDTSHIDVAPKKYELQLIERELVTPFEKEQDTSFEPRQDIGYVEASKTISEKLEPKLDQIDILTDGNVLGNLSTPIEPEIFDLEENSAEFDPFDTTIAENIKPGKTELKLLEAGLL